MKNVQILIQSTTCK